VSVVAPHLEILPPAQGRLWKALAALPPTFVLYGGTALALRTNARASEDFDFFTNEPVDAHTLPIRFSFLDGADLIQADSGTATFIVDRGGPVKISFFSVPLCRVGEPDQASDTGVKLASLLDIAAQKVRVVQVRAERKDYFDLATLITGGIPLASALGAAKALYPDFSPLVTLKALAYFEDGDLPELPATMKQLLEASVADMTSVDSIALLSKTLA
jgi:hypothetical protein